MRLKEIITEGETIKGLPSPLYHGGQQTITKFKIPAYGVFFSPHREWAENYGPVITAAKVNAAKVYVLDHNNRQDDQILDALFDRDYVTLAKFVKLLQSQGYHAMQTQTDSEMVVVFPGTSIQVLDAVDEDINPDIRNPKFEHEQQIGDYRYTAKTHLSDSGFFTYLLIRCYDGDKLIGKVNFEVRVLAGKKWLESQQTQVDGGYTNKGIASTMYAYAKMLGNDIKPSPYQSDDGKAMWKAWKKSGAAKHLTTEDFDDNEAMARIEPFGGIYFYLEDRDDDGEVFVQAMYEPSTDGSTELGYVLFAKEGNMLYPRDLEVDDRYHRQGIASTMYDYVKSKGYKIRRSPTQTDAGAAFWDKHKPGKQVWEQQVDNNQK